MLSKMRLWIRGILKKLMDEYRLLRQSSIKRAWTDTFRLRGHWAWFILIEIISVALFAVLAIMKQPSNADKCTTAIYAGSGSVSGLLTPFLVGLIYNFLVSPYKQRNEVRKELQKMLHEGITSEFIFDQRKESLLLRITNIGQQPVICSAKMVRYNYVNQVNMERGNDTYDIPWVENDTKGELKLKSLSPQEPVSPMRIAKLDGTTIEGRKKEFGDGANLLLQRITITETRLIVDLDSIVEFQIRIFANHLYSQNILRIFKVKVVKDDSVSPNPSFGDIIEDTTIGSEIK